MTEFIWYKGHECRDKEIAEYLDQYKNNLSLISNCIQISNHYRNGKEVTDIWYVPLDTAKNVENPSLKE